MEPEIDRIATDPEQFTGFAPLETVQFDRLDDFLPEVVTVCFSHWGLDRLNQNFAFRYFRLSGASESVLHRQ